VRYKRKNFYSDFLAQTNNLGNVDPESIKKSGEGKASFRIDLDLVVY